MECLQIEDRRFVQSPETTVTTSSSVGNVMSGFELQRSKLNAFLEECQIQALGSPWLEWAQASQRTRQRYVQRTSGDNFFCPQSGLSRWPWLSVD